MSKRIEDEATNMIPSTGRAALECKPPKASMGHQIQRENRASLKMMSSAQKNAASKGIVLTPLSLLVLAACGGGGSDGTDDGDGHRKYALGLFNKPSRPTTEKYKSDSSDSNPTQ